MYCFKTYIKYLPGSLLLHTIMGLSISLNPKVKITINNDPKWLVITKFTFMSTLWGSTYPITWPITAAFIYKIYF